MFGSTGYSFEAGQQVGQRKRIVVEAFFPEPILTLRKEGHLDYLDVLVLTRLLLNVLDARFECALGVVLVDKEDVPLLLRGSDISENFAHLHVEGFVGFVACFLEGLLAADVFHFCGELVHQGASYFV